MKSIVKAASLAALVGGLAFAGSAAAETDNGPYIGFGLGSASIEADGSIDEMHGDFSFDGDDLGYKAFAGWNFALLDLVTLGVELGYVDFGEPDDGGAKVEANGFDAFGLAGVQLGPVQVFGKLGLIAWDADGSFGPDPVSDDGTDLACGVGAGLQFGSLGIRAEYELFDIDGSEGVSVDDVSLLSASVLWVF
jgi:opacity protein-like surface antigen